ncbi:hypothetical protein J2S43_008119 [Catenuloplanes nepalensis]|uniref:Uncharacterized protein n=1 Tax=Catenuloplanes nepalensis TaxID=587533 RepID=A0ABT9N7D8_9ACTN|nr:hypothetical protein [Catenuloplanes nepalensis]MDP9799607.1 hypothetical protein [Catenuloplanes nepalensis]
MSDEFGLAESVIEVLDEDGDLAALQIVLDDGSALVCTVWTDWSLRTDRRPDAALPDYLWPPESYTCRPLTGGGRRIVALRPETDEAGERSGLEVEFEGGHRITARSVGGDLVLT